MLKFMYTGYVGTAELAETVFRIALNQTSQNLEALLALC